MATDNLKRNPNGDYSLDCTMYNHPIRYAAKKMIRRAAVFLYASTLIAAMAYAVGLLTSF